MRKRKNKERIDEISQGLLIKLKNRKNRSKKITNCFSRNRRKKKKKNERKGRNKNKNKTTKTTKKGKN